MLGVGLCAEDVERSKKLVPTGWSSEINPTQLKISWMLTGAGKLGSSQSKAGERLKHQGFGGDLRRVSLTPRVMECTLERGGYSR